MVVGGCDNGALPARQRLADAMDERVETVAANCARRLVGFGQGSLDHQFVADEQGETFEQDMTVALDAPARHRHAINPLMASVLQLTSRLIIKPYGPYVGKNRSHGRDTMRRLVGKHG